ncbi:MAG TPA: hypothetical protein DCE81_01510 [Cytophagales bacterium]|nr:hypothetical protein [Cytophagales bacterium]
MRGLCAMPAGVHRRLICGLEMAFPTFGIWARVLGGWLHPCRVQPWQVVRRGATVAEGIGPASPGEAEEMKDRAGFRRKGQDGLGGIALRAWHTAVWPLLPVHADPAVYACCIVLP